MTDLVERLRNWESQQDLSGVCLNAADEIERLRENRLTKYSGVIAELREKVERLTAEKNQLLKDVSGLAQSTRIELLEAENERLTAEREADEAVYQAGIADRVRMHEENERLRAVYEAAKALRNADWNDMAMMDHATGRLDEELAAVEGDDD